MQQPKVKICWLRRDLRLHDHAALYYALRSSDTPVLVFFLFDKNILDTLAKPFDARVQFIYQQLIRLKSSLRAMDSDLLVLYDSPEQAWQQLCQQWHIEAVYANHDYEPYARQRDEQIAKYLASKGIPFHTYKDQVIFEKSEVLNQSGQPYQVFSPYARQWCQQLNDFYLKSYPTMRYFQRFYRVVEAFELPKLEAMGFRAYDVAFPPADISEETIRHYDKTRDWPALEQGTTRLGVHLRFGTLSIRELVRKARLWNSVYLNELIWREFYMMLLWHYPQLVERSFKPAYDAIAWRKDEEAFVRWCQGQTGYPMVDAGMRQLNATGYMHNRLRMITASFLTKHLLIDWRRGEAYFAQKLLDYELSSNNGGWQWAAGSGCDAAPYFRIFNPLAQQKKFDPQGVFVRRWVPEYGTPAYPQPMIRHEVARQRAIETYRQALSMKKH